MSKVSIQGDISGTGDFTIKAPNSNVDRTLNLPDEAGTLATVENLPAGYTDSDALDLFNVTGSAPVYACRAWVNFDGTGTVSIRDSGNVSSITDEGTGKYTVNFVTDMPDSNYCAQITAQLAKGAGSTDDGNNTLQGVRKGVADPISITGIRIQTGEYVTNNLAFRDNDHVFVSIFR